MLGSLSLSERSTSSTVSVPVGVGQQRAAVSRASLDSGLTELPECQSKSEIEVGRLQGQQGPVDTSHIIGNRKFQISIKI